MTPRRKKSPIERAADELIRRVFRQTTNALAGRVNGRLFVSLQGNDRPRIPKTVRGFPVDVYYPYTFGLKFDLD